MLRGGWEGATLSGVGSGLRNHPMRGLGKGFGAEGGFTRNERGAHGGTTVPLQRSCAIEGGVGDVGDVHLGGMVGWKGVMPKSSHHRGLARCHEKGKKEWSAGALAARSCRHTMSQWVGGWTRLVVGYT